MCNRFQNLHWFIQIAEKCFCSFPLVRQGKQIKEEKENQRHVAKNV